MISAAHPFLCKQGPRVGNPAKRVGKPATTKKGKKMTIDERLEALLKSSEALHASLLAEKAERIQRQERTAEQHRRLDQRERQSRQALAAAIAAYITALNSDEQDAQ